MADKITNKALLLILDGFAFGDETSKSNPCNFASIDNLRHYKDNYPFCTINASEESVGLLKGQMGNSEVGHMTIGSGQVIKQNLLKINDLLINKVNLSQNKTLQDIISNTSKTINLMGLVSNGGVHSHINHYVELIKILDNNSRKINLHIISDGRDVDIKSINIDIKKHIIPLTNENVQIATISGRYYAMDRDNNQERVKQYYDLFTNKIQSPTFTNIVEYIDNSYKSNIFDEFIVPAKSTNFAPLNKGDCILFCNFRSDRARQIISKFQENNFNNITTMTDYFSGNKISIKNIINTDNIKNTLSSFVANSGMSQLKIAETEKYAHVTFFLNGGQEQSFDREERIMIDSPKVKTYDQKPEMSLPELTRKLVQEIKNDKFDLIVCNIANADMVGHTGNFEACIKALNAIDTSVKTIIDEANKYHYTTILTADHGNIEETALNGKPHTQHTINKVPLIVINKHNKNTTLNFKKNTGLSSITPTILKLLGVRFNKNEMSVSLF